MRKLPETGLQFIREFEEEEGTFVAFAVFWFAPDDEAIDGHAAEAALGVHLHGLAGDLAVLGRGEAGLIASDLIEQLPAAIRQLEEEI